MPDIFLSDQLTNFSISEKSNDPRTFDDNLYHAFNSQSNERYRIETSLYQM